MNKRGVAELTYIIVLIAMLVGAALISSYILALTKSMTNRAVLRIAGASVVDNKLYLTILNDGSSAYTGPLSISVKGYSVSSLNIQGSSSGSSSSNTVNVNIQPGDGIVVVATLSSIVSGENVVEGAVSTNVATLSFKAVVSG
ncbi:MAG: hypothetical protein J7L38_02310 [Thermoproteales archaeon]|nr:hypothetical protein [Thermoproteales archaeon]